MAYGSDLTISLAPDPLTGATDLSSPEAVKRKQELAAALLRQGNDYSPILSPWQGAARLAAALAGGLQDMRARREEKAGKASATSGLSEYYKNLPGAAATATGALSVASDNGEPAPARVSASEAPAPSEAMTTADVSNDDPNGYRNAISSIESGGKYGITGPVTRTGDRAYGRYQVMGANIPQWTKEALGESLTPAQFLANPQAQDAVFDKKFGSYVEKYGNPQDAASVWFSGRPMAQAGNAADQLGTTVPGYVQRFSAALKQGQPVQVASLGNAAYAPSQDAPLPPSRPTELASEATKAPADNAAEAPEAPEPTQVADASNRTVPAAPAPAQQADPGKAARVRALMGVMNNPWAPAAQRQIAGQLLQQELKPEKRYAAPFYDKAGNLIQVGPDGQYHVVRAAEKPEKPEKPTLQEVTLEDGSKVKMWLKPGQATGPRVGSPYRPKEEIDKVATANQQREAEADRLGITGDDRKFYVANGKLPTAGEKQTNDQANAAVYATRMRESDKILSDPEVYGTAQGWGGAKNKVLADLPFGTAIVPDNYQRYDQAKRDFVNATLRRESGAAISSSEFANADKQYFPQPGDSDAVIAQKKRNRVLAMEGIANAGTPEFKEKFFGSKKTDFGRDTAPAPAPVAPPQNGPKPGEIQKGYRFKGGDPAKRENWEAVSSGARI